MVFACSSFCSSSLFAKKSKSTEKWWVRHTPICFLFWGLSHQCCKCQCPLIKRCAPRHHSVILSMWGCERKQDLELAAWWISVCLRCVLWSNSCDVIPCTPKAHCVQKQVLQERDVEVHWWFFVFPFVADHLAVDDFFLFQKMVHTHSLMLDVFSHKISANRSIDLQSMHFSTTGGKAAHQKAASSISLASLWFDPFSHSFHQVKWKAMWLESAAAVTHHSRQVNAQRNSMTHMTQWLSVTRLRRWRTRNQQTM